MRTASVRYIRCPDCGGSRKVSDRHQRRLAASNGDLRCAPCRTPRAVEHGNDEVVYWLNWAGVNLAAGASGLAYIRVFGMPPKLNELIGEINGSVRYLP